CSVYRTSAHPPFSSRPTHTPFSTLFPYTTLFRSHHCSRSQEIRCLGSMRAASRQGRTSPSTHIHQSNLAPEGDRTSLVEPATTRDRKSTRLNSSHGSISYAVFCLKTKRTARSRRA